MMKKKSKNIANILIFLGILLTLSIVGYKALSSGIYSPHISIGKIQIDGLYLRLNNKLILEIQKIDLSKLKSLQSKSESQSTSTMTTDEILGIFKKFLFVISYFETLHIKELLLPDERPRSLHYDGVEYLINTPEFVARFGVEDTNHIIKLLIYQLDILGYDLLVQGNFAYLPVKKTLEMDIAISPKKTTDNPEQPTLFIKGATNFHKIQMEASSSQLYDLNSIKPYILKLRNPTLNDWLFKNIKYEMLKLHSLRFQTTLDKHFFHQLQKTLALDLTIESPKVYLAPTLKPIEGTKAILYMRDEKLKIMFQEPSFASTKLNGSEVELSNLFTKPLGIKISVRSEDAKLNNDLGALLEHFHIPLPLRSVNTKIPNSKIKLELDIDISPAENLSVLLNGSITAPQTTLKIGEQNIKASNLNLRFVNQGKKEYISIENTSINFDNSVRGVLNAQYNLKDSKLRARFGVEDIILDSHSLSTPVPSPEIPEGSDELTKKIIQAIYDESKKGFEQDMLSITQTQLPFIDLIGDFSTEQKSIEIPAFDLTINIEQQNNIIELKNLTHLSEYSPLLKHFGINNGHIRISTQDFQTINLDATIEELAYPIYDKNKQRIDTIALEGIINQDGILITSKDKRIMFSKEGNVVKIILNGYDLYIDEIFESKIPILAQSKQEDSVTFSEEEYKQEKAFIKAKQQYEREHKLSPHITYFETSNMDFYLSNYLIPSNMASISLRDGAIRADVTYGNGIANVDISHSRANLRLSNFSAEFLNRVWQKKVFSGGLFNFKGIYNNNTLRGEISMQNTAYKDLVIVQNVLALIDTIPALLTFRKPGLGANGYEIKEGKVNLLINSDYLVLEEIELTGSSIDVEGGGYVNLHNKELNVILKASTLKTLADIIDKIPLVNYVILGRDGKFTTGIVMEGTLDKPVTNVSVAEDILFSPFEIVGRLLEPFDKLLGGVAQDLKKGTQKTKLPTPTERIIEDSKKQDPKSEVIEKIKNINIEQQELKTLEQTKNEPQDTSESTNPTSQSNSLSNTSEVQNQTRPATSPDAQSVTSESQNPDEATYSNNGQDSNNQENEEINEPNLPRESIDEEENPDDMD